MRRTFVAFVLAAGLFAVWATPAQSYPNLSPTSLSFPPQVIGTQSAHQTISVGLYNEPLSDAVTSIAVDSPDFVGSYTCPDDPASCPWPGFDCPTISVGWGPGVANRGCFIYVTFRPLEGPGGLRSGTLTVNGAPTDAVLSAVSLSGTAVEPATAVDPRERCIKKAKKKFKNDPVKKKKAIKACNKKYSGE